MTVFEGIVLGIVQGLTEFLPISSSGHLVLAERLLGLQFPGLTYEVSLHAGTLLAVLWAYRRDLFLLFAAVVAAVRGGVRHRDPYLRLGLLLVAASVPAGLVGLLFEPAVAALFDSLDAVGLFWLVTGTFLWAVRHLGERGRDLTESTLPTAIGVGVAQAFALLPGISRSGSTIAAGMALGLNREAAARFSFLLSIPAVGGATLLDALSWLGGERASFEWAPLLAGVAAATVAGLFAITFLLRVLQAGRLGCFAVYCWIVGALALILL